jgi:hypothetical protein
MAENHERFGMSPEDFSDIETMFADAVASRKDPSKMGRFVELPKPDHILPGETPTEAHLRLQGPDSVTGRSPLRDWTSEIFEHSPILPPQSRTEIADGTPEPKGGNEV